MRVAPPFAGLLVFACSGATLPPDDPPPAARLARPVPVDVETTAVQHPPVAGKPISKVADEYADMYAFVLWQLGAIDGPEDAP